MEKVTGGSTKESDVRTGTKKKQKRVLAELKMAIDDCREIIWGYGGSPEPNELLFGKLSLLERDLLDAFYKAVPFEKGAGRAKKKEKQAQPAVAKIGA